MQVTLLMNWKCFFPLILIYVVVSFAQFDWTVTVCPRLPQDVWTRRHQLHTIISTTRLSCKFNKEERRRRREWSFCVVLSIHHCTQHIHRGNDMLATDKREKKKALIDQPLWCTSWLFFILEKQKYTTQRWPTELHFQAQQLVFIP